MINRIFSIGGICVSKVLCTYVELHVQSISSWDHGLASFWPNPLHSLKYWARDRMKNQVRLSELGQIFLVQFLQRADKSKNIERCRTVRSKRWGKKYSEEVNASSPIPKWRNPTQQDINYYTCAPHIHLAAIVFHQNLRGNIVRTSNDIRKYFTCKHFQVNTDCTRNW